jgi:GMP synthase (glutamine-hydrolysing)
MPKHFLANVFHSQTVLALPEGAVCLAKNSHEPHQAFRLGTCAWGVQFHPEFTLPLMRAYILENECDLKDKGLNVSSVSDELEHTPTAPLILKKFVSYVQSRKAL